MCKTTGTKKETKQERLRRKLVNNELNPVADFLLSILILMLSPFIYMFAQIHDKLMFKFLNRTYIYNVSWEVMAFIRFIYFYLFFYVFTDIS